MGQTSFRFSLTTVIIPSMYFAIQGLCTACVGAISTGLIWPNLRNVTINGNDVFGAHLMPYIAAAACFGAIIAAAKMPAMYSELGKEEKKKG